MGRPKKIDKLQENKIDMKKSNTEKTDTKEVMAVKLNPDTQETGLDSDGIGIHHDGDRSVYTITAAERWSKGLVQRLKEKYPNDIKIIKENKDGSILAEVPFKWVKISPPKNCNYTEEQRAAIGERLKNNLKKYREGKENK